MRMLELTGWFSLSACFFALFLVFLFLMGPASAKLATDTLVVEAAPLRLVYLGLNLLTLFLMDGLLFELESVALPQPVPGAVAAAVSVVTTGIGTFLDCACPEAECEDTQY